MHTIRKRIKPLQEKSSFDNLNQAIVKNPPMLAPYNADTAQIVSILMNGLTPGL
jgi:hypothetical protein